MVARCREGHERYLQEGSCSGGCCGVDVVVTGANVWLFLALFNYLVVPPLQCLRGVPEGSKLN